MHSLFIQFDVNVELAWIAFTSLSVQWELIQFKLVWKLINDLLCTVYIIQVESTVIRLSSTRHRHMSLLRTASVQATKQKSIPKSFHNSSSSSTYVLRFANGKKKEKPRVYTESVKKWQHWASNQSWCDLFQLNNTSTRLGTWCTALIKSGAHDAKIGCERLILNVVCIWINHLLCI